MKRRETSNIVRNQHVITKDSWTLMLDPEQEICFPFLPVNSLWVLGLYLSFILISSSVNRFGNNFCELPVNHQR